MPGIGLQVVFQVRRLPLPAGIRRQVVGQGRAAAGAVAGQGGGGY